MRDRYTKLPKALPTSNKTASHIASLFLDKWVVLYGVPKYVLTDNETKLISGFCDFLCALLATKNQTTTVTRPQTEGQSEHLNKTIIARVRHSVTEHKRD